MWTTAESAVVEELRFRRWERRVCWRRRRPSGEEVEVELMLGRKDLEGKEWKKWLKSALERVVLPMPLMP